MNTKFALLLNLSITKALTGFGVTEYCCLNQTVTTHKKSINDKRQAELKAYIGKDGQTVYNLTLKFGRKALSRYARNLDIAQCIPETPPENWFYIDVDKKEVVIQLD